MSTPWSGSPHHQLVEVITLLATYLSPAAVIGIAETTCRLVNKIRHKVKQQHQRSFNSKKSSSSETSYKTRPPKGLKQDLLLQERIILQEIDQESQSVHQRISNEHFPGNLRSRSCQGEDFVQLSHMELMDSVSPGVHASKADSSNRYARLNVQRASPKPRECKTMDTCCLTEQNSKPLTNMSNVGRTNEEYAPKSMPINLTPFHKPGHVKPFDSITIQGLNNNNRPCADGVLDNPGHEQEVTNKLEVPELNPKPLPSHFPEIQGTVKDNNPDALTNKVCADGAAKLSKKINKPKKTQERPPKGMESVHENTTVAAKEIPAMETAKDKDESKQELKGHNLLIKESSSADHCVTPNVQKREKSERTKEKSPTTLTYVEPALSEPSPPAPRKIYKTSSRDSFSMACSSTSVSTGQSDTERSETESHTSHFSDNDQSQTDTSQRSHTSHFSDNDQSQTDTSQREVPQESSVNSHTSLHMLSPSQERQYNDIQHSRRRKGQTVDGRKSSRNPTRFSDWWKSVLKAWFTVTKPTVVHSTQTSADSNFNEYDVRNLIKDQKKGLWASKEVNTEDRTCPHSCASSLCNFRLMLESFKKELKEIHDAFENSPKDVSAKRCSFCHKDRRCKGPKNCYTMKIAQEFWNTILEFKQAHLHSCDCPHIQQRKLENAEQGVTGDNSDKAEQCYLGHLHSCKHDFMGCSQLRNTLMVDTSYEAPCVHVLLDEIDSLQQKLLKLRQTKRSTKSADDPEGQDHTTSNSENDSVSPTSSASLTEEMEELEQLTEFFLGDGGKEMAENQTIRKPKKPNKKSRKHRLSGKSPKQKDGTQTANKKRKLGQYALRYLEHIESNLNTGATAAGHQRPSPTPVCGGDSPARPLPCMRLHSDGNSLTPECTTDAENQAQSQNDEGLAHAKEPLPNQKAEQENADMVHNANNQTPQIDDEVTIKAKCLEEWDTDQKNAALKMTFDKIIADLIQFQQNHATLYSLDTDAHPEKSPKIVKFSPSSTQRSNSQTSTSSAEHTSAESHCLVPSNSACSSPGPNEDSIKDLSITEAFDQLDKVVDELIFLMEGAPEPCTA